MIEPLEVVPIVSALRAGELTPAEHANSVVDRIDRLDREIRAFVPEPGRRERLGAAVGTLTDRYADVAPERRPALYGLQVGIKDVIHVDGLPTRGGSALPEEVLAGPQATVVTRLLRAGAIITGKTVTAEFAFCVPGPTRNPHALDHTPGGSSSGSAAAVAAGMVPCAVGTQTVGSVIRPAAYCGVVGFKPTYGRIPADGLLYNAPSFDTLGIVTVDLAGAALVASVVADGWRADVSTQRPVLGLPSRRYLEQAEPAALTAFGAQVEALAAAGYEIRETSFPADIEATNEHHLTINHAEMAEVHHAWYERYADRYRAGTAEAIQLGRATDPDALARAREAHAAFGAAVAAEHERTGVDVWISPAATGPAPSTLSFTGDRAMNLPWTHGGMPTVTLPAGRVAGTDGVPLPVGLQCAAPAGTDEQLLAWAEDIGAVVGQR